MKVITNMLERGIVEIDSLRNQISIIVDQSKAVDFHERVRFLYCNTLKVKLLKLKWKYIKIWSVYFEF